MKLECPVCQSKIEVERIDDGVRVIEVEKNGDSEEVVNKSNGGTTVRCSSNHSHKLPIGLQDAILELTLDGF